MAYQIFMDSFDGYGTWASEAMYKWNNYGGALTGTGNSMTLASGLGRRGTNCLKAYVNQNNTGWILKAIPSSAVVVVGFAINIWGTPGSFQDVMYLYDGGYGVRVAIGTDNKVYVYYDGTSTLIGTSVNSLVVGGWAYIEVGVTVNTSGATGKCELRVNGDVNAGFSQVTTRTGNAGNFCTDVRFGGAKTLSPPSQVYFDDLYIAYGDSYGWQGDCRVDCLALTGDSTPQDWTASDSRTSNRYQLILANSGSMSASTVGNKMVFDFTDISHNPVSIKALQAHAWALKTDAGTRSMQLLSHSGSSETDAASIALGTSISGYLATFTVDPNTSAAWTQSGINASQIGVLVSA